MSEGSEEGRWERGNINEKKEKKKRKGRKEDFDRKKKSWIMWKAKK